MPESDATTRAIHANLLTADEAKTRQCRKACFVQPTAIGGAIQWFFPTCDGPSCGHWRWHTFPITFVGAGTPHESPRGCCGLAGHP